jgi:hypothetical protein
MTDVVLAAATAAYPELFGENVPAAGGNPANRALVKQDILARIARAVKAADDANPVIKIAPPPDAQMVLQTLAAVTYLNEDGNTLFAVYTQGDGQLTSWLGMNVMTQDYLLSKGGFTNGQGG